jgi:hypothetical protein
VGCHTHTIVRYVATPYQKNTIPSLLLTRISPHPHSTASFIRFPRSSESEKFG